MGLFDRFLSSRCPVDDATRGWVVDRYAWLLARFGRKTLRAPMVLPTPEFFPERFDGSQAPLESAMQRIATRLQVDPDTLHLELHDEANPMRELMQAGDLTGSWSGDGAAGSFHDETLGFRSHFRISISCETARHPTSAVATLAHELCHALLLGDHYLEGEEEDGEPLTDLATVFFGYGIFTANAHVQESTWQSGARSGWSTKRQGYLDYPTLGFALAYHAAQRKEPAPPWAGHLRADARKPFRQAMRCLQREQKHDERRGS